MNNDPDKMGLAVTSPAKEAHSRELFMRITDDGKLLVAAQHQDKISSWPRWQQLGHKWLVAPRCQACIYWNDKTPKAK